jgi:hypothetical protein
MQSNEAFKQRIREHATRMWTAPIKDGCCTSERAARAIMRPSMVQSGMTLPDVERIVRETWRQLAAQSRGQKRD